MDGHLAGATKQQFFAQHRGSTQEEPASLRTFVLGNEFEKLKQFEI